MLDTYFSITLAYGPSAGALDAESPKVKVKKSKNVGREICVFLIVVHHILDARSCNNFLWFPHTPSPPRPIKRPKNFNLLFAFFQCLLFLFNLGAHLGYGYTSRAGESKERGENLTGGPHAIAAMFDAFWHKF